jgi:hypothetical protein
MISSCGNAPVQPQYRLTERDNQKQPPWSDVNGTKNTTEFSELFRPIGSRDKRT